MLSKMPEIIAKIFIMALKYIIYQQAFAWGAGAYGGASS